MVCVTDVIMNLLNFDDKSDASVTLDFGAFEIHFYSFTKPIFVLV